MLVGPVVRTMPLTSLYLNSGRSFASGLTHTQPWPSVKSRSAPRSMVQGISRWSQADETPSRNVNAGRMRSSSASRKTTRHFLRSRRVDPRHEMLVGFIDKPSDEWIRGPRYNKNTIAPGAQTERRGDAGPVSALLG